MAQPLRIFISSPGDVEEERRRAAIVVSRLAREFARFFEIKPVLWEYEPMLASGHFQDIIEPPSHSDIQVVILWSRLGTPLPVERYRGIDGRTPVTGTEWEFEDALRAHREHGAPDLLVYRKKTKGIAEFDSTAELEAAAQQRKALEQFWDRYFGSAATGFKAAFNLFTDRDEFEQMLEFALDGPHPRAPPPLRPERARARTRSPGIKARPIAASSTSISSTRPFSSAAPARNAR